MQIIFAAVAVSTASTRIEFAPGVSTMLPPSTLSRANFAAQKFENFALRVIERVAQPDALEKTLPAKVEQEALRILGFVADHANGFVRGEETGLTFDVLGTGHALNLQIKRQRVCVCGRLLHKGDVVSDLAARLPHRPGEVDRHGTWRPGPRCSGQSHDALGLHNRETTDRISIRQGGFSFFAKKSFRPFRVY